MIRRPVGHLSDISFLLINNIDGYCLYLLQETGAEQLTPRCDTSLHLTERAL
jgi:hypothetical protein